MVDKQTNFARTTNLPWQLSLVYLFVCVFWQGDFDWWQGGFLVTSMWHKWLVIWQCTLQSNILILFVNMSYLIRSPLPWGIPPVQRALIRCLTVDKMSGNRHLAPWSVVSLTMWIVFIVVVRILIRNCDVLEHKYPIKNSLCGRGMDIFWKFTFPKNSKA